MRLGYRRLKAGEVYLDGLLIDGIPIGCEGLVVFAPPLCREVEVEGGHPVGRRQSS
jgi:hypothetical protein